MESITWGALLFPGLEHLLAEYGIDPHAGIDALFVSVLLVPLAVIMLVVLARRAGSPTTPLGRPRTA